MGIKTSFVAIQEVQDEKSGDAYQPVVLASVVWQVAALRAEHSGGAHGDAQDYNANAETAHEPMLRHLVVEC